MSREQLYVYESRKRRGGGLLVHVSSYVYARPTNERTLARRAARGGGLLAQLHRESRDIGGRFHGCHSLPRGVAEYVRREPHLLRRCHDGCRLVSSSSCTPLTRLLHASCTPRTRLVHASCTPLARLLHASCTPRTRLVHASCTPLARLLHACYLISFVGVTAVVAKAPPNRRACPLLCYADVC
jgi:hypothetical protein